MSARGEAVERVLAALREHGSRIEERGGSWMAQCPAEGHDDRKASLSVAQGDCGAVLCCQVGCSTVADVLPPLKVAGRDLFDRPGGRRTALPSRVIAEYRYTDEKGELLYVKERREPKDFRIKEPDGAGGWTWKLSAKTRRVLYRLPELTAAREGETAYLVEGEKDADRLASMGLIATCNFDGAAKEGQRSKWRPEYGEALQHLDVVIIADRDPAGVAHARAALADLRTKAKSVSIVQSAVTTAHADVSDHLDAGYSLGDLVPVPETPAPASAEAAESRGPSQASVLVQIAADRYRLLLGDDGQPYAVSKDGPNIALPFRGNSGLRTQLAKVYADQCNGSVPSSSALTDALTVLTGRAETAEPEPVALRVAPHGDGIVLDLGTADGRCVVIRPGEWRAESRSPVLFRRTRLTSPLPDPYKAGDLSKLRDLLNVDDDGWHVIVGWLLAALLPACPSPILSLFGLQGTSKSVSTRMLIKLVDPSPAPTRTAPKDIRTWAITANAATVVGLDNVSSIPDWLSDALCRAVTGEGLIERALYSDADVNVIAFRRVIVLNGIDVGSLAGDLAERLIPLELEPIKQRREEAAIWRDYDNAHPYALGGLLDMLAKVLKVVDAIEVTELPRMADFARVLAALDHVTGWDSLAAYKEATDSAQEIVVESSTFSAAVREFAFRLSAGEQWKGTATKLLTELTPVDPSSRKPRPPDKWPKNARAASGRLKRDLPALASVGVDVAFEKDGGERCIAISTDPERSKDRTRKTASFASPASSTPFDQRKHQDANEGSVLAFASRDQSQDANAPQATSFASTANMAPDLQEHAALDAKDANDGTSQVLSSDPAGCPDEWPVDAPAPDEFWAEEPPGEEWSA